MSYTLHLGDCLDVMPGIEAGSVDFIFTDPPYPYIKREYGYWTEETWFPMMQEVVRQGRRILKPHGSMVMVLQPNSEKVGKMRLWLWRLMLWCGEYWNIVQDAYWWNYATVPGGLSTPRSRGLLRQSLKVCLWLGDSDCYRNQDAVLWTTSDRTKAELLGDRCIRRMRPSGNGTNSKQMAQVASDRGGSTPFNVLPILNNSAKHDEAGAYGHGAGTPLKLTDWWIRYLTRPGDTILDPFNGSGTTGVAALKLGRKSIGIEQYEKYYSVAQERMERVEEELRQAQIAKERQPYLMTEVTL